MLVPVIDFDYNNFVYQDLAAETSSTIKRLTTSTISGAQVLNIPVFAPNGSYTVAFNGTSLKCETPNNTIQSIIDGVFNDLSSYAVYAAFSPFGNVGSDTYEYWPNADDEGYFDGDWSSLWSGDFSNWTSSCAQNCIQGSLTCSYSEMVAGVINTNYPAWYPLWLRLGDERFVCSLQNTLYNVSFNTTGEFQSIAYPIDYQWLGEVSGWGYYVPLI